MSEQRTKSTPERKSRFDAEMITATAAVVIGVCALVVSLFEVRVMRSQQKADVWPYVIIGISNADEDEDFSLILRNLGTGPAIKKSASIKYNGRYLHNWSELIEASDLQTRPSYNTGGLFSAAALPAGELQAVFSTPNEPQYKALHQLFFDLEIKLCYCSLLDECWTTTKPSELKEKRSIEDYMPQKGACSIKKDDRFLQ